ncbi:MAG: flagellar export protein FliJ [Gammaproteobacteria bacterium]|nr:flagellar export protein FliJ [Gammaproteobacteria bacterium]
MVEQSKRMQPVSRIADQRERKAAQAFGDARQAASHQEQRLNELRSYRQEYVERFEAQGRSGLSGAQVRDYQRFIDQLDRAIAQQEDALRKARESLQGSKQEWLNKNTKATAIRNVVGRFRRNEAHQGERAEQKEVDNRPPRPQVLAAE